MSSQIVKDIKNTAVGLSHEELEELYEFFGKLLGRLTETPKPSHPPVASEDFIPVPKMQPSPDQYHSISSPFYIDRNGADDENDDDDDDDESSMMKKERCSDSPSPSPKIFSISKATAKQVPNRCNPESPEFDPQCTNFNPDAAKNILQQYHQTYINPATTPRYIPSSSFTLGSFSADVHFLIEPGGTEKVITGIGRKTAEAEKNAALRACVYLEQNNPGKFKMLRLPANARLQSNGTVSSSSSGSMYGLSALNAAGFLFYCRDTGVLSQVIRTPSVSPGGGFIGKTQIVASGITHSSESSMHGRKQDAQNSADLKAALWVVENLGVRVPSGMAV